MHQAARTGKRRIKSRAQAACSRQVTLGQKTAYYIQVMETVSAESIHDLFFLCAVNADCRSGAPNGISGMSSLPSAGNAGGADTDVLKER